MRLACERRGGWSRICPAFLEEKTAALEVAGGLTTFPEVPPCCKVGKMCQPSPAYARQHLTGGSRRKEYILQDPKKQQLNPLGTIVREAAGCYQAGEKAGSDLVPELPTPLAPADSQQWCCSIRGAAVCATRGIQTPSHSTSAQ